MDKKLSFNFVLNVQCIFILFFLSFISKSFSLHFTYPNAITLKNKNIFIIHKDGITICDANFTTIIKNIITFSSTEKLLENDLHMISLSQFDDGYIICIIINKLYIFDINGIVKISTALSDNKNTNFVLAVEKVSNTIHYYLIGYINQNSLYLLYLIYNSGNNSN